MTDRQETLWRLDAPSCAKHIDMTISHVYNAIEMEYRWTLPSDQVTLYFNSKMNHTMASNGDIVGYLDTTNLTWTLFQTQKLLCCHWMHHPSNVDAQYKQVV